MLCWMKKLFGLLLVASVAACGGGDDDDDVQPTQPVQARNLVQVAQADARFSILVEAVQAAGLAETLSAPSPMTVFAPTNDAFAALLTELGVSKAQLLANKTLLTAVLKYHVVAGNVASAAPPARASGRRGAPRPRAGAGRARPRDIRSSRSAELRDRGSSARRARARGAAPT